MNIFTEEQFQNTKFKDFLPVKCVVCGNIFKRRKSRIYISLQRNSAICCSKQCQTKLQTKKEIKKCKVCGKETKSEFCSHSCAAKFSNKNRTYRPQDDKKQKQVYCTDCGKSIYVDMRTSSNKGRCEECIIRDKLKKCNFCGTIGCKNLRCRSLRYGQLKTFRKLGFDETLFQYDLINETLLKVKQFLQQQLYKQNIFELCYDYDIQPRSLFKLLVTLGIKDKTDKPFHRGYWHDTWNSKKVFLRSMLELRQAKFFDINQINYEVEKIRIKYKNSRGIEKTYIPDFYLPERNLIIEIKGKHFEDKECILKEQATREKGYEYRYVVDSIIDDLNVFKI